MPLVLKNFLKFQVLFGKLKGSLLGLLMNEFLVLLLALSFERGSSVEQLVASLDVLLLALLVIIHQESGLVILVVNLFEVAVFAATSLLRLICWRAKINLLLGEVALMAYQERLFSQVLVSIVGIRL